MSKKIRIGIVDEIGIKEAQASKLKEEIDALKAELKDKIEIGETITETNYYAKKGERITTVYSPQKIKKKIGNEKKFLEVVSVSNTKAKKYLGMADLDQCVEETKTSEILTIKPIKKNKEADTKEVKTSEKTMSRKIVL